MDINYKRLFHQLILALSKVLDIDESRKLYHAQRTAVLGYLLSSELCPAEQSLIYYASLLHDIGGIGLFDHILHHPSPMMQASNPAVRVHPVAGAQIVNSIPGMQACVPIILNHHEYYDGHGYPGGKSVEQLPLGAQIVRGADSFDLLVHVEGGEGKRLKEIYARKAGKEVSSDIAELVCQFVDDKDTLLLLSNQENIEQKCLELNQGLPGVKLPQAADVIGTFLQIFAQVIDTKHSYTAGHSQRVAKYSVYIGLAMGLPHDEVTKLKWAALIHDLGKVAIPRSILDHSLNLNQEEFDIVKQHPRYTIDILSSVTELKELGYLGAHHHERWDGNGYSDGLKGKKIPLISRIVCIADSFDSLTSDRSYRKAIGTQEAIKKLVEASGTQFDPDVLKVATSVLWSGVN